MKSWKWHKLSVHARFALLTAVVLVVATTSMALLSLEREQQSLMASLEQQASTMLHTVELLWVDAAGQPPSPELSRILDSMVAEHEALLSLELFDLSGQPLFGASTEDARLLLPAQNDLDTGHDTVWFIWGERGLLAGRNLGQGAGSIGSARVGLSTATLSQDLGRARAQVAALAFSALMVGILLATVLGRAVSGVRRRAVAPDGWPSGEALMQALAETGGDESAALGYAMERMRAELKELRAGLEKQVADRTRELRESEERFRSVVSSISDIVYMAESGSVREWSYVFMSPNVATLSGYDPQQFMAEATRWSSLVQDEDGEIYSKHLGRLAAGQNSEVEYRILNAANDTIWVRDNGRVKTSATQSGFVTYGVISNITERRQAAVELERLLLAERDQRLLAESLAEVTLALTSETGLETLLDDILRQVKRIVPYAIATISLLDADGLSVVRWRRDEAAFAGPVSDSMTSPLADFPAGVDLLALREPIVIVDTRADPAFSPAKDREWVRSYLAMPICQYDQVLGLLHLDGELPGKFMPQDAVRLLPLANAAAIAIENARLVTDLAEVVAERTADILSEQEKSETILRNINDAIVMSDLDNRIQYVNRAFTELTGFQSDDLLGSPADVVGPAAGASEAVREALSKGRLWHGEVIARRKDSRTYDAALTVAPVLSAEGKMVGQVASHRDISDSKALERLRGRFMTNVSHQLRTPVTNIKLYVDLLKRAELPEKSAGYLKVLLTQTNRLESLVQDILELTSLDSGQLAEVTKEIDLATVLTTLLVRFRSRAEEAKLSLALSDLPTDLPKVTGDEVWLSRAIGELIDNAINFTPPGGEVTLHAVRRDRGNESGVALFVSDTGPGVAQDEQGSIFDRFYRGRLADAGDIPGTGLGLSIVTEIMRAHGGEVTLESEPGQGATFIVWLPAS